ncbi:MAG: hypothetical protein J7545_06665 [Roseofilum sp. SBFL]|uniref:hypothetical protein n=1 Tax=Roseofilum sp. SID3 TaxID=2821499 RepID=UPI001B1BDA0D|nr:hypothetical protein [Roseofilum sp. SID3]MBP0041641.1 hypothetical protein [Roseofilum sp. SBFL]
MNWFFKDTSSGDHNITPNEAKRKSQKSSAEAILSQLSEWLQDLRKTQEVIPLLTYEDAIQYFITDRPSDSRIEKGAILRQPHPQGQFLAQMFLDSSNQILYCSDGKPYGRKLVVKTLDRELEDTFGTKDLIIVE